MGGDRTIGKEEIKLNTEARLLYGYSLPSNHDFIERILKRYSDFNEWVVKCAKPYWASGSDRLYLENFPIELITHGKPEQPKHLIASKYLQFHSVLGSTESIPDLNQILLESKRVVREFEDMVSDLIPDIYDEPQWLLVVRIPSTQYQPQ